MNRLFAHPLDRQSSSGTYFQESMTANVTFDIGVITNVDDKSSSFTAMAALSFYWRDNALSEWNVKEAFTAMGNTTPQYYAECFGEFFAAGSTGTNCVLQAGQAPVESCGIYSKGTITGTFPQGVFGNVKSMSAPLPPRGRPGFSFNPHSFHNAALKLMGPNGYMEGTCNPDNLWDGCAFNFAYNQEMRQMQFSNEGWDLKWYPFDSRVLYIKIRLHKDQRKVFYNFPEMPRAMQIGRSVGNLEGLCICTAIWFDMKI